MTTFALSEFSPFGLRVAREFGEAAWTDRDSFRAAFLVFFFGPFLLEDPETRREIATGRLVNRTGL